MHEAAENSGVNDIKSTYNKATNFKDMGLEDLQLGPEYSADLKPAEDIPSVAPPKSTKNKTASKPTKEKLSLIHISEPTRLLSISYAVFCLKKKKTDSSRHCDVDTT